jgi:tetratricopeptide (TPR) repeat protein
MTLTPRDNCRLGRQQEITRAGNELAKQFYMQAIDDDPKYMPAYAELSYVFVREYQCAWGDSRPESLAEARELADKAIELATDPDSVWFNDFRARWYNAMVYWNEGDFVRSFDEFAAARKQITDPARIVKDTADLDADMAEALVYYGEPHRAVALIEDAMQRNHGFKDWYLWNYARALHMARRYKDSLAAIDRMKNPPNDVRLIVAASQVRLGDQSAGEGTMEDFSLLEPDWSVAKSAAYEYGSESDRKHWTEGLQMAGLKAE